MISRVTNWLSHGLPNTLEQCARPAFRPFSSTSIAAKGPAHTPKKKRPRYRDPYANKHAEARRAANIARQAVLRKERAAALGDPIRGIPTPFVESFDTALPPEPEVSAADLDLSPEAVSQRSEASTSAEAGASTPTATLPRPLPSRPEPEPPLLNHFLTPAELDSSLSFSHALTAPIPSNSFDPSARARALSSHATTHSTAAEALTRILSLRNASSKALTRVNTQRCIATFGRHATDTFLRPQPLSAAQLDPDVHTLEKTPRAGRDTGSSEVQIAILTAKIRVLADHWEGAERNDKVNKRNLRLLLHRRQKLLKYMQRKEKGGDRWPHLVGMLGLSEATWKGQIAVEDPPKE
ncbi:hypothetical protein MMC13_002363 [Lambiella insularis]|nr:hypothetical protein [Lambiella insularis]